MSKIRFVYRIGVLAFCIISIFVLTLFTGHLYNTNAINKQLIENNRFLVAKLFILRTEMINAFLQLPDNGDCDPELFSELVFDSHFIKDIGIIKNDTIICNALSGGKSRFNLGKSPAYGTNDFEKVWIHGKKYYWKKKNYFVHIDTSYLYNNIRQTDLVILFTKDNNKILDFHWYSDHINENEKRIVLNAFEKYFSLKITPPDLKHYIYQIDYTDLPKIGVISVHRHVWIEWFMLNLLPYLFLGLIEGLLIALLFMTIHLKITSPAYMLRKDIKEKKLTVVYQPLIDLKSNQIIGCEALLRWKNKSGNDISPDVFVPLAEKEGFSDEMTLFVCERVLKDLEPYLKSIGFYVSINFTANDLHNDRLSQYLLNTLKEKNIPLSNVVVELSERAILDPKKQIGLSQLIKAGGLLSIDDFGTGVSNISYLGILSPYSIKIDKQFVDWSDGTGPNANLLHELIKLGKSFNIKIIVEGVEKSEQADRVLQYDADIGQGYYWYKSMPIDDLIKLLKTIKNKGDSIY